MLMKLVFDSTADLYTSFQLIALSASLSSFPTVKFLFCIVDYLEVTFPLLMIF